MWTITDGGYEGSPYGYEAPSLYRIDAETFTVEKQFKFKLGDWPSEVQLNGDGDKLYWINKDIWCMDVTTSRVPVRPFLEYSGTIYYGLTVNPANGEVYIADAIDYQQQGMIYRYSPDGELIDEFYVGHRHPVHSVGNKKGGNMQKTISVIRFGGMSPRPALFAQQTESKKRSVWHLTIPRSHGHRTSADERHRRAEDEVRFTRTEREHRPLDGGHPDVQLVGLRQELRTRDALDRRFPRHVAHRTRR